MRKLIHALALGSMLALALSFNAISAEGDEEKEGAEEKKADYSQVIYDDEQRDTKDGSPFPEGS